MNASETFLTASAVQQGRLNGSSRQKLTLPWIPIISVLRRAQWACIVVDDLFGGTARWEAFWEDKLQIIGFAAAGSADVCRLQVEYITPPSAGRIWISWIPDSLLFLQPNLGTCASHLTFVKLHFATMFAQATRSFCNWNLRWCCSLRSICFLSVGSSKQGEGQFCVFFWGGGKVAKLELEIRIASHLRKISFSVCSSSPISILISKVSCSPYFHCKTIKSNQIYNYKHKSCSPK